MPQVSTPYVDLSHLPPETLEVFGRVALEHVKVESLIGYVFATWLDAALLGVLFILFSSWLQYFGREPKPIRVLAVWLVLSSMGSTAIVHGLIMNTFVAHFGEYKTMLMPAWYKFLAFGGTLVKVPAAAYFLWRAYVLIGRKIWILIVVGPQIALCFVSGCVLISVFTIPYRDDIRIVIASVSACEVLSDIIVTATIATQLYRSRTGFAATDRLITKLLFLLAETATPPTISALIVLFFYALLPNSPTQMALTYHSKVNAICVLISLLGKFRIADAYKAEPVTIGFTSSKLTGRSTDPTIVVPYDESAFAGAASGVQGLDKGNKAAYPFTGSENTYEDVRSIDGGIGIEQQGWARRQSVNRLQEERDRIEPVGEREYAHRFV